MSLPGVGPDEELVNDMAQKLGLGTGFVGKTNTKVLSEVSLDFRFRATI